jgi:hypothetical protein
MEGDSKVVEGYHMLQLFMIHLPLPATFILFPNSDA